MNKKSIFTLLVVFTLIIVTACGNSQSAGGETTSANTDDSMQSVEVLKLRLGHIATETNPYHLFALKFKELVEEKTDGQVEINIFPNAQLGEERELLEAMQFGNLDLGVITSSPITNFVNEFGVLDIPYIFNDWEHIERFLASDVAKELVKETEKVGIKTFTLIPRGFRSVTTSTPPVYTPDDLSNVRMRVIESEVYLDTFNELGATPIAMPWGEAYTAMQQGAIDGQENDYHINYAQNVAEVQKYISLTEHIFSFFTINASLTNFENLPLDIQAAITESAEEASMIMSKENQTILEELKEKLIEQGMEFNEVDKELFRASVQNTQEKHKMRYGEDYFNAILETQ